jgi:hypothetical protein
MTAPVIQFKRGLLANLPGLRAGEPGFTTDSYDLYVGLTSETSTNKFFGSHRYWTKETTSTGSGINLVEGTSNGSDFITLKSPDTLAGIVTYTLPATDGNNGDILTTNGSGTLTFSAPASSSFNISGDSGTDTVSTGSTLTFAGTANEIETAVTDNQVQIGLPNNVVIGAALTVTTALDVNESLNVDGHSELDNVNVSGTATITSLDVQTDFDVFATTATFHNNVIIDGNFTVNGTETIINVQSLNVADKEIVLGLGTNGSQNDASASGGGIAIASTEGNPLVDFTLAGIHTHPNTYKDIVWIKADDLGVGTTDAWHFNYAVGIGSTQVPNGVRFAVTNTQITDSTLSTPQINVSGISTFTGLVDANGGLDVTGQTTLNNDLEVTGISTFTGLVDANGGLDVTGQTTLNNDLLVVGVTTIGTGVGITQFSSAVGSGTSTSSVPTSSAVIDYVNTLDFGLSGDSGSGTVNMDHTLTINGTANEIETSVTNQTVTIGLPDNVIVGGALTATSQLTVGTGVGITQFSSAVGSGTSTSSVPTSSAVIDYVGTQIGAVDLTITTAEGTNGTGGGGGSVSTSQTLTFNGTSNEIDVTVSGQSVTYGLPATVQITTSIDVPTVEATNLKAKDGATAITITDASGAVTTASDLTVGGNLYVNGSTTQVNTSSLTVEDRTIELGLVDGAAPSSATTWDLGVLFNYHATSAKKSAVVWEQGDARFKFASEVSDGGGTDNDSPQITFTAFAPIEIGALWVNDCAGQSQVISCTGTERFLENITVDAGTF